MGLQKLALNFMVERGGKLAKSLLCSKPQKSIVNIKDLKYIPLESNIEKIIYNKNYKGLELWNMAIRKGKNEAILRNCHIEQSEIPLEFCVPLDYIKDGKLNAFSIGVLESSGGGLGTEAIKEAVKLSHKLGQEGRLVLVAVPIDTKKGNPIPFYYKMGFKSLFPNEQLEIEKGMIDFFKSGKYSGPEISAMYLPMKKIKEILSHISLFS